MIKLSDRLQMIADLINVGETVADIGTDHGFLPVFLWECKKSPRVILADISRGSLQKAVDNAELRKYDEATLQEHFSFRLGNGIQILQPAEVDTVVIAGMGGILMTEILGEDLSKTRSFKKIILQPRNGQGKLRWWLLKNGFTMKTEKLVREGKFICEILCVECGKNETNLIKLPEDHEIELKKQVERMEYEIPESLLINNGALGLEFLIRKLKIEQEILENVKKSAALEAEKLYQMEEDIRYLLHLFDKYKERLK